MKEGLAGEVLQHDLVLPVQTGNLEGSTGSGSVISGLQDQLPVPISNPGRPGNLSQVRGFGVSSEDVDTQSFGISLNPSQGGGFDLSAFPAFLWSGFTFQSGPSANGLNPSAPSGTLSLKPWTVQALDSPTSIYRVGGFYSTAGAHQLFAGGRAQQPVAWVLGYSFLNATGPSAGLSSRWFGSMNEMGYSGGFHFLVTDVDAQAQGPVTALSPLARMRTTRLIPVLESAYRWSSARVVKSTFFTDFSILKYQDSSSGALSRDRVDQWGVENSLELDSWRLGLSLRQASYFGIGFEAPQQTIGSFQASHVMGSGSWLVEPRFQATWVNGFGFLPQGSLGFRNEWGENQPTVFFRLGLSQRVPSLLDRYFSYKEFVGNPNLKTEESWNFTLGTEWRVGSWDSQLQAFGQLRNHVRVPLNDTVTNLGGAEVLAIQNSVRYELNSFWILSHALVWSPSRVEATGRPFPYLPLWTEIMGATFRWGPSAQKAEWSATLRASSSLGVRINSEETLPAFGVLDTALNWPLSRNLSFSARVENLLNHPVQWIAGYPVGRIVSFLLSGQI